MKKITTKKLVTLALLIAISFSLHYIDSLIPSIIPIPGFRLGLSNLITLFALYYFGCFSFVFVVLSKTLLVATLTSGFGITFLMSLAGSVLSMLVSILLYKVFKPSIYTVSIYSSVFHTLGQLLVYALFFSSFYIFLYLLYLGPISILTGYLIALLDKILINRLPASLKIEERRR